VPEYRISLDSRNPGQFFACCGLFELAELGAPGAEAAFGKAGADFLLQSEAALPPESLALEPQPDLDEKRWNHSRISTRSRTMQRSSRSIWSSLEKS
jgi:hypothetical protein